MQQFEASWRVVGVISELRELTSQKNEKWRGYVCKVATLGLTAEISLTVDQFKKHGVGEHVEMVGSFEMNAGHTRLVCQSIGLFAPKAGKP